MGEIMARSQIHPNRVYATGTEADAANPRQLEAIPSSKYNRALQMKEMPRSNTAKAEGKFDLPSSKQRKKRQELRFP
jgi:hypothetical protein